MASVFVDMRTNTILTIFPSTTILAIPARLTIATRLTGRALRLYTGVGTADKPIAGSGINMRRYAILTILTRLSILTRLAVFARRPLRTRC